MKAVVRIVLYALLVMYYPSKTQGVQQRTTYRILFITTVIWSIYNA